VCPCGDNSLCKVLQVPERKEFFVFLVRNDTWKHYDWNTVTTVAVFTSPSYMDPELYCQGHLNDVRLVTGADYFDMGQLSNKTARTLWLESQVHRVVEGGYDGINVDTEEPLETKDGPLLTSLVASLRDTLKQIDINYQVTFDVGWSPDCIDLRCYDYIGLAAATDFLFVMSYDMRSQIFGPCVASANTPSNLAKSGLSKFIEIGITPNKLILGLPWYGYDYPCTHLYNLNQSTCNIKEVPFRGVNCSDAAGREVDFTILDNIMRTQSTNGREWNIDLQSPWFNYLDSDDILHQVWYDDPQSIIYKVKWARELKLRGVGMWTADFVYPNTKLHRSMWNAMNYFFAE